MKKEISNCASDDYHTYSCCCFSQDGKLKGKRGLREFEVKLFCISNFAFGSNLPRSKQAITDGGCLGKKYSHIEVLRNAPRNLYRLKKQKQKKTQSSSENMVNL